MIAMASPIEPIEPVANIPAEASPGPDRPLTPAEALVKLFMDNADRDANAANDELVSALRERARAIQALADRWPSETTLHPPLPETTARE